MMLWTRRVALLGLTAITASVYAGHAQVNAETYATKCFLDEPPTAEGLARLLPDAREVIVAKVRIVSGPVYLGRRDQSGRPPLPPKDLFAAWIEIVSVIRGDIAPGHRIDVSFGVAGGNFKYPHTPQMKAREYFVVSYTEKDERRRLLDLPISQEEYEQWDKERWEYERTRGRPGAQDR